MLRSIVLVLCGALAMWAFDHQPQAKTGISKAIGSTSDAFDAAGKALKKAQK
jgi:hypothetical protein